MKLKKSVTADAHSSSLKTEWFGYFNFEPRNESQKKAAELFKSKRVLFLLGQAGSGKTFAAVALALQHTLALLTNKKVRDADSMSASLKVEDSSSTRLSWIHGVPQIVLTRPVVEAADEHLGFIPGDTDDKIAPYLEPAYAVVDRLKTSMILPDGFDPRKLFKAVPLAYLRGWTLPSIAVLEEAQNCNLKQLVCFLTRLGKGAKAIITADPSQNDVASRSRKPPIVEVIKKLSTLDEVGVVHTTAADNLRDPFVNKVLKAFNLNGVE